jgi:hypothetical protein
MKKIPPTTLKRTLTNAEMKSIRSKQQSYASLINKLKENPKINQETKSVLRKMHKCIIDAVRYSDRLNYIS